MVSPTYSYSFHNNNNTLAVSGFRICSVSLTSERIIFRGLQSRDSEAARLHTAVTTTTSFWRSVKAMCVWSPRQLIMLRQETYVRNWAGQFLVQHLGDKFQIMSRKQSKGINATLHTAQQQQTLSYIPPCYWFQISSLNTPMFEVLVKEAYDLY